MRARRFQAQGLDALRALLIQRVVQFHAGGVGLIFARGHDDDAAVARAQVVHLLARLQFAQLQHLIDDGLRRREIRRDLGVLGSLGFILRPQRRASKRASRRDEQ